MRPEKRNISSKKKLAQSLQNIGDTNFKLSSISKSGPRTDLKVDARSYSDFSQSETQEKMLKMQKIWGKKKKEQ